MPKAKNAKADEALKLYRQGLKLVEISEQLGVPEGTIRSWKNRQQWDENVATENCNVAKRKRGAQPGNKNASGAPPGNKHAEKYGTRLRMLIRLISCGTRYNCSMRLFSGPRRSHL